MQIEHGLRNYIARFRARKAAEKAGLPPPSFRGDTQLNGLFGISRAAFEHGGQMDAMAGDAGRKVPSWFGSKKNTTRGDSTARDRAEDVQAEVKITNEGSHPPAAFSSGERSKLNLTREAEGSGGRWVPTDPPLQIPEALLPLPLPATCYSLPATH